MKRIVLALVAIAGLTVAGSAEDLVADGKKVYNKCKACHAVGPDAKNRVGPELNDLFGRTAGTVEKFKYSAIMVALGEAGLVWNEETIAGYVGNPKKWLVAIAPEYGLDCKDYKKCRGKMVFAGLKKPKDIEALNAYLKTFDSDTPDS